MIFTAPAPHTGQFVSSLLTRFNCPCSNSNRIMSCFRRAADSSPVPARRLVRDPTARNPSHRTDIFMPEPFDQALDISSGLEMQEPGCLSEQAIRLYVSGVSGKPNPDPAPPAPFVLPDRNLYSLYKVIGLADKYAKRLNRCGVSQGTRFACARLWHFCSLVSRTRMHYPSADSFGLFFTRN